MNDTPLYLEDGPKAFAIAELKREIERYAAEHFGPIKAWYEAQGNALYIAVDTPMPDVWSEDPPKKPVAIVTFNHKAKIRVFDTDYTARWGYDNGYVAYRIIEAGAE
jgi:hypothetical protein